MLNFKKEVKIKKEGLKCLLQETYEPSSFKW